ncbi:MAG: thiamine-monophosphate kinase, partial [Armatimonadetes bacterium]|nr:thiamine-monophosphate kinase [Akkermansiaceae bacterium]
MKSLGDIGEDALVERLVKLAPTSARAGERPGDDCAVVDAGGVFLRLLKTDALVEGIHYEPHADPVAVGWKAVARVVSDFAAMGGKAEHFLATLALRKSMRLDWVEGLYVGMGKCLEKYGAILVGGETCRVPEGSAAVISISADGSVARDQLVLRSGGNVGDELWVTGNLGGSLAGKHLSFLPRLEEAMWLAQHFKPSAMMDVSDGLAKDLPRLASASGRGFRIDERLVPRTEGCTLEQALGDGEDYELLFSLAAGADVKPAWEGSFPSVAL